jgi:hypothetical protein
MCAVQLFDLVCLPFQDAGKGVCPAYGCGRIGPVIVRALVGRISDDTDSGVSAQFSSDFGSFIAFSETVADKNRYIVYLFGIGFIYWVGDCCCLVGVH